MAWKDLSIRDKAAYIKDSVSNGIYNIADIRNKYAQGGQVTSDNKEQAKPELKRVDIQEWFNTEGNRGRAVNVPAMEQLQDSLIARGWGMPQRLAIMATAAQEMDKNGAASRGVGGNGYLGYSESRMPIDLLDDTPQGRAKQINYLFNDLQTTHSDNWLDGGSGGPTIMSGKDGYNQFWNGSNVYETTRVLNKSNIRPAGRLDSWNNRADVAKAMQKHMFLPSQRKTKAFGGNMFDDGSQIVMYDPDSTMWPSQQFVAEQQQNSNTGSQSARSEIVGDMFSGNDDIDVYWDPENLLSNRDYESAQQPIKSTVARNIPLPQRRTIEIQEFNSPRSEARGTVLIPEDSVIKTNEDAVTEGAALGDKSAVTKAVDSLKSGEDLKEFQKQLLAGGYYKNLPAPKITAKTKSEIMDLQRMLAAEGYAEMLGNTGENKDGIDGIVGKRTRAAWEQYVKDHPLEALEQTVADGKIGPATREAARAYYKDIADGAIEQRAISEERPIEKITDDSILSFPQYLYRSGSVGTGRRIGNVVSSGTNLINGFLNPHGNNATLSEGARRQMVAASLAGMENRGTYGITDVEHQQLGGMNGHSGEEFRRENNVGQYLSQMADAPYHNIYGQSGSTYNEETQTFSPGEDSYTFNNQWTGDKVTKVYDDGEGTGSLEDAYNEFVRARESGATIKAAIESAASVRGVDVKPKKGKSNEVSPKKLEKYRKEYERYLSDERFRRRFERRTNKNR